MKFKFSLEGVKRVFSQKQNQAKLEVSRALRERNLVKERVEKAQSSASKLTEEFQTGKLIPGYKVQSISEMLMRNDAEISGLERELVEVDGLCEQKRQNLREINRRKVALEKLEKRQQEDFDVVRLRKEQKQLDEVCNILKQSKA